MLQNSHQIQKQNREFVFKKNRLKMQTYINSYQTK